jgi:hypothetical protein
MDGWCRVLRTPIVATVVLGAASLVLASCSADHGPTPTPSAPSPAPTTAIESPETAPSPSASSQVVTASQDCVTNQLAIQLAPADGGLSHDGIVIVFHNHGPACAMRAYPGVDGITPDGTTVHAQRSLNGYIGGAKRLHTVIVGSGATA